MLQGDFTIVSVNVSNSYCLCYRVILPLSLLMFVLQGDFTIASVNVSNSYCLCYREILPLSLLMFLTVTVCVTGRFYHCLC